jgi:hypothetical protein
MTALNRFEFRVYGLVLPSRRNVEEDADFERDDLLKEPNNRSMDAVTNHAERLIFVDERIKEYFFSKATEVLEKNQWDE